ncbi:hypothetical protein NPIL_118261 [Nephila pilipes]|uniref:Uncharacterized protein n=1 Tax=Nephila pilipes TaxID=299642 RepID=A0A8X6QB71_NEPPI|nr:hypothetical protein NPIL_118261 [Nephila pilipes]
MFPNYPQSLSKETSTHFPQRKTSVCNLGLISSEFNEPSMEESNSGIHYPDTFSNESISQYAQQSSVPLNYQGSISNESFTYFTQQQSSVYDHIMTSGKSVSNGNEQSNSYLNYPGQMFSENNPSSMQQSSSFLNVPVLKSSESISNDMQPSLNYAESISNESFTHFTQQEEPVYDQKTTSGESVSNGNEQSNSYLNYPGQLFSENNLSSMQQSRSFLNVPDLKSNESVWNDRHPSSIRHNKKGTISNESFPYFTQGKSSLYYPIENINVSNYCGTDQSISYLNYPGYMSRENNSNFTQHSISSLHESILNSIECASYDMYEVNPVEAYNLGAHTNKNISSDIKNPNSSFANMEYNLTGYMSRDMQNFCSSFSYQEAPSNDNISYRKSSNTVSVGISRNGFKSL